MNYKIRTSQRQKQVKEKPKTIAVFSQRRQARKGTAENVATTKRAQGTKNFQSEIFWGLRPRKNNSETGNALFVVARPPLAHWLFPFAFFAPLRGNDGSAAPRDSEREGFEPPSRLRRIRFSRPARSATPPSLHGHRRKL